MASDSVDRRHRFRVSPNLSSKLNWLRAGALGANDGIISTAALVFGATGAELDSTTILIVGLAGLVAGFLSMAGGEFVSVSTQRDTQIGAIEAAVRELQADPEAKLKELVDTYVSHGLPEELAIRVAVELTGRDAVGAHARAILGIRLDEILSPWQAALASMTAFTSGALVPLLAMTTTSVDTRIPVTLAAVAMALVVTGLISSHFSGTSALRSVGRNLMVGLSTILLTYLLGLVAHIAL